MNTNLTPDTTTSLSQQRPDFWTNSDGTPITALDADLFSAPSSTDLVSAGWTPIQAQALLTHIGRKVLHGSKTRNFAAAYRTDPETGEPAPRFYEVTSKALKRCQYVVMTHPQRAAVLVIDIDTPSHTTGGKIEALHPEVRAHLTRLHHSGHGPAWIGVNPLNGKAQALWMIDPVYASENRTSPNMELMKTTTTALNHLLGGDKVFSHRFSRWPLHVSDDPTAYVWHCQHTQIIRLTDLLTEVRTMNPSTPPRASQKAEQYKSGRERIQAAQDAVNAAQALHALDAELRPATTAADGFVDGVKIMWIRPGRTARDETAFRHALATGHRLKATGQPLKDAKIIDAYERAYNLAQALGADNREPDLPPMRDRLTMARRVRAYVTRGITTPTTGTGGPRQDSAGRKALATLGRRGGQTTVARRAANPEEREPLRQGWAKANQRRKTQGTDTRARVLSYVSRRLVDTDVFPTRREISAEVGISMQTVTWHLSALRKAGFLPDG